MERLQFHPLDFVYKVRENKAAVYIYGRTAEGKGICVVDTNFLPYFYIKPASTTDVLTLRKEIEVLRIALKEGEASVLKTEVVAKELSDHTVSLIKVYTSLSAHVSVIKKELENHPGIENCYEHDLGFVNQYLMNSNLIPLTVVEVQGEFVKEKSKVPVFLASSIEQVSDESYKNYKILAFDIETYNPLGKRVLPEEHPIVMLAFYSEGMKKVITWKRFKTDLDYIEFVDGEIALLNRFKEVIEQYRPDIISGYFSDGFDFPYILSRAKKYGIKLDLGLDYSKVSENKRGEKRCRINGIVHLDVFKFIKRTMVTTLKTDVYTLDAVGQELLGEKKKEVELDQLAHDWDNHPENLGKYCEYNLHDAYLTYNLCEKIIPNIEELVKIVRLPLFSINRMSFSSLVENYILSQAKNFNVLAPNKPSYDKIKERHLHRYKGGFVFEPKPGLNADMVVFDFRSLYPTIISSHNIAGSSLRCSCCESAKVPGEDYWFCTKRKAFLPTILENLITRRMRIKTIMAEQEKASVLLKARSNALKLLANAFYGYFGFFAARWYSIECARSITAYARDYIGSVIEKSKAEGFEILYGDTDSVFLSLGAKEKKDAFSLVEQINVHLPGLMELEYEGFYPYGLFVSAKAGSHGAKKKYALLSEKGDLVITGFESVRRNWSLIAKETQEKVLNIILKERDVEKAFQYVKEIINDLRGHRVDNAKVIINTRLQKDIDGYDNVGPHVAVAKKMKEKGYDVGQGSRIQWVVTPGKGIIRERAKLPEEVAEGEYDEEYYVGHQVVPAVDKILEVLGYDKESLTENKEQMKLGDF